MMVNDRYTKYVKVKPIREKLTVGNPRIEFVADDKLYERVVVQNFGAYPVYAYINGGEDAILVTDSHPLDIEIPIDRIDVELPLDRYEECEAEVQILLFR